MQTVVQNSYARGAVVIVPAADGVPAAVSGRDANGNTVSPSGAGVYAAHGQFDPQISVDAGVARTVQVIPFAIGGDVTFTLTVYGLRLIGSVWHPVQLYNGSCVCDQDVTGDEAADSIQNEDKMASAITPGGTPPAGQSETTSLAPAHVLVSTRGCPFLYFTASNTDGRVAVCPVS